MVYLAQVVPLLIQIFDLFNTEDKIGQNCDHHNVVNRIKMRRQIIPASRFFVEHTTEGALSVIASKIVEAMVAELTVYAANVFGVFVKILVVFQITSFLNTGLVT